MEVKFSFPKKTEHRRNRGRRRATRKEENSLPACPFTETRRGSVSFLQVSEPTTTQPLPEISASAPASHGFTCIEAAEGQNGHVLQAGGGQWFQDREGERVQGHGDVDHQGMEPAQVQRNGKLV